MNWILPAAWILLGISFLDPSNADWGLSVSTIAWTTAYFLLGFRLGLNK